MALLGKRSALARWRVLYGDDITFAVFLLGFLLLGLAYALAREGGQWQNSDARISAWYQSLMQPDNPRSSCCGEADAFEADTFEVAGDHYVAIITDGRGEIPSGSRIPVPNYKMKWDSGNPTGHGIVFLSSPTTVADPPVAGYYYVLRDGYRARILYCYVAPGGV